MKAQAPVVLALTLVTLAFVIVLALGVSVIGDVTALFSRPVPIEEGAGEPQLVLRPPPPTPLPLPTATPTPLPTLTPTVAPRIELAGLQHAWQTWNNCGPATLAMNLSYFGFTIDQGEIGAALRQNADDKNVGPHELAAYARARGLTADVHINGDADLLRRLLNAGIPVLIETWHEEETPSNGLGHYRLLTGYDDAGGYWIAYDTYDARDLLPADGGYRGLRLDYGEMDALWRVFNRTYLTIYPPDRAETVATVLGAATDTVAAWPRAHDRARAELAQRPDDAYGWFNLGSSALYLGNPTEAAQFFDRARSLGLPWRMLWYQFGPFEAYWATGRYDDVIALADTTIASGANIEELHYWRGMALASLGRGDEARQAWQTALQLNPAYSPAAAALAS